MESSAALSAFAALSQPTRLAVVRLLVRQGPDGLPAGDIARRLKVRPNTLSANLSILAHAGLVHAERQGRLIRYTANLSAMHSLVAFLLEDCCGGRPELCRPVLQNLLAAREAVDG
ncbi:MAG: ArsR/SmtB family transcription factor [Rhodothalassiaceae bacterium]